jgi:hypothetical protein
MTSPYAGKWVFHYAYSSAADCANDCAGSCGNCVRNGSYSSCSRAAVLAPGA